jgi:formylglycine-generating enzyme required for sulfatase activity
LKISSIIDLVKDLDTSHQTKNLNKLLIRILLHLQVEFNKQNYNIMRTKRKFNFYGLKQSRFFRSFMLISFLLLLQAVGTKAYSNGVVVTNVSLSVKNTTDHYVLVNFDIAWNNSWRVSTGPSNWDASWVFVKYRIKGTATWQHSTLHTSGHTTPANSTISTSSDGKGIFIYRDADMEQGSVSYTGAQLRWDYGVDGVADGDAVEIVVSAIEMVYVPQASFYVGSGGSESGSFTDGSWTSGATIPLLITSEGALGIDNAAGKLWGTSSTGDNTIGNAAEDAEATLPAAFPKGYNAFYCMKYEITQEQYVDFLNKLTYTQQATRTAVAPNSAAGTGALSNNFRNGIDIMTAGVSDTKPAVYACNLDADVTYNDAVDGQNIACNWLSWADVAAYLDWAALRPFTELEYEKACRGTLTPVANEYAWGSTSITQATGISNGGANNETASNSDANCAYGNPASVPGPMRSGNFGQGINTRIGVGASYYGIMELSGNLWERPISVGNATGRGFTGTHGNGAVDASGNADVSLWPGTDAIGTCFRGGDWYNGAVFLRVSDRSEAAHTSNGRAYNYSGRGVRSVP